jgi:hypothetical protein
MALFSDFAKSVARLTLYTTLKLSNALAVLD